jgi:DDE superfamily endonuclease
VESGLHQKAPRNWAKNITLLSSIGKRMGMGASLVVEGSTNRTVFETYLEDVLFPTLERGQVVVMDNLSSHKGERVKELKMTWCVPLTRRGSSGSSPL